LLQELLIKGIRHLTYKSVVFGPKFLELNIPDKWQVMTLDHCVCNDTPITYGIVQAGPHIPDGIPYIRTGDMSGDKLSIKGMLRTSKEIASSFQRSQVKAGEIVCALRGIVGKVLEVPRELDGANLTQGTARISPRDEIDNRYLLWALRSEYARRQFEIFSKGITLNEITLERLRKIKVAIPPSIKEQKDLVKILDWVELSISLELGYKEKFMVLKKGLMQNLLTGKIRVKI
jgi:type I restriction enzyme S subunit